jgi:hypothetical protein
MIAAFLKCRLYPQGPLVVSLFHVPVFVGVLRGVFFKNVERKSFYKGATISLGSWAFIALGLWLAWMLSGTEAGQGWKGQHTYTDETKRLLVEDANPIYAEFKFEAGGQERRTHYDMDCEPATMTDFLCDHLMCTTRFLVSGEAAMRAAVRMTDGLWCCTRDGTCKRFDPTKYEGETNYCLPLKNFMAIDNASWPAAADVDKSLTTLVYKVTHVGTDKNDNTGAPRDNVFCCSKTVELVSEEKEARTEACAKAKTIWFLVWMAPFVAFGCNILLAIFCFTNGVYLNTSNAGQLERTLKQFVLLVGSLMLMMWVATAISGSSMRLTGTILSFCFAGLVVLFIWVYLEIGTKVISVGVRGSRLMQTLISLWTSDWVRALMIIGLNVLIPAALLLNMLNQFARRSRGMSRSKSHFTDGMNFILSNVVNWNWASILTKCNWWCLLYWTLAIGVAKLTQIFLSWLNDALRSVHQGVVWAIFFMIGFTMFMNPAVPGVPVYLASGVIIAARAKDPDDGIGFWNGIGVATILSFVLKLVACSGQYAIGYYLGKSVKVQQMVGVDKPLIRAVQQILEQRGLTVPKVAILIGGPDWPTSVMCGILKLNLFQILFGTVPVLLISTPVVFAGACLAGPNVSDAENSSESGIWDTLTPVMLGAAGMSQIAAGVIALYYIQEVLYKDGDELAKPRKEHEPVARLTAAEQDFNQAKAQVMDWKLLASSNKIPLLVSTVGLVFTQFLFVFADTLCFRSFELSNDIDAPYDKGGLNGEWFSVYKPLGIYAHVIFILCTFMHFGFLRRISSSAQVQLRLNKRSLEKAVDAGTIASENESKRQKNEKQDGGIFGRKSTRKSERRTSGKKKESAKEPLVQS